MTAAWQPLEREGTDGVAVRIAVRSRLDQMEILGRTVRSLCRFQRMPSLLADSAELCVVEAATNAVVHSYCGRAEGEVSVVLAFLGGTVRVIVSDDGKPMSRSIVEALEETDLDFDPTVAEDLPESGLGLHVICSAADDVRYSTRDGVNSLSFVLRAEAAAGDEPRDAADMAAREAAT